MNNEIIIFHRPNILPGKYEQPISINFDINNIISVIKVQKSRYKIECNLQKDPDTIIRIKLPKCDGNPKWRDAIAALSKYLTPYSIGDMKKMNLKTFTYKIKVNELLPLYYIARTMNFANLSRYIEISIDSGQINAQQIACFYLDCKDKLKQISFPEMISHFELILEKSPPLDIYLTSLHFADIVLGIQKQRQNREFIRKWLHNVFEEFDKTQLYFNSMHQIVSNHQIISGSDAFIIWAYSQYFPSINGEKRFASVLSTFELTEDDLQIPLTEKQAVWFFENRKKKESLNSSIIKQVVPYVCALSKTDQSKCFQLFKELMISINSLPDIKSNLSLEQLLELLFLAAHPPNSIDVSVYKNAYDQISKEIHQKLKSNDNNEFIFESQKEIMKLSWEQLFETFRVCEKDPFIELCYKWLKKNQTFSEEDLNQFYSLFPFDSKEENWKTRYSYILFRVFDLLNQQYKFDLVSLVDLKKFFEGAGSSSLEKLFNYIFEKNKIFPISPETLNIIHQNVNLTKKEQILLVLLIKNFQIRDFTPSILLPVYKDSLDNVINLLILLKQKEIEKNKSKGVRFQIDEIKDYESNIVIDGVIDVARKYYGKIKTSTIISLTNLVPFNYFFSPRNENDTQKVELLNEDRVVLYASLSDDFDPALINFPQLTYRLVSTYIESQRFQFNPPPNSPISLFNKDHFLNSPSMVKKMIDIKKEWMNITIPRFLFHQIGMVSVCVMSLESERTANLLRRSFAFVGVQNVNVIFPSEESSASIPEDNPVLIIKPLFESIDCPLAKMVNSFLLRNQPLAMNANSFESLMAEEPDFLGLAGLAGFERDSMERVEWGEPHPEFLPFKENLPLMEFKSAGDEKNADVYFHSICCKLKKKIDKKVEFANGRLFAAKILPMFSMFNYDIAVDGDEQNPLYWACLKHMALTTLSLFFDFRWKFLDDSSS